MAVDADFWSIPFNRGFTDVGLGTTSGACAKEWTADYPELIIAFFDFQYIRPIFGTVSAADEYPAFGVDRTVRFQLQMDLDGVLHPGTGPFAAAQDGKVRGTGYAGPDLRSFVTLITQVPPGKHRIVPRAALAPDAYQDSDLSSAIYSWWEQSITPGPGIAGRKLILLRFPYGTPLGA